MQNMVLAGRLLFPIIDGVPEGGRLTALATLADETLMSRFRDGDTEAFEALYRRHRAGLHRFARRMVPDDADEIFQEVWLAIVKGKRRYVPSARFVTYLFTIAHRRAAEKLRTRGRAQELSDGADQGDTVMDDRLDPLGSAVNTELGRALSEAIDLLSVVQREAFLMQAEGGLSLEEIAQATGTSRETVKSRLRYAYRRLRTALEDWK
ncbi:MAG: sigma-70 family RNA polymerase sigma factor [Alphaproteobacteria bacterium]|nr:sigma-70 family RNA polymerase sigma factor [Alphaproteobacteria bacterium]MDE2109946.1 sigma-70 family RNA polymerase sigma factor [Alphaproteobacteria bacterium]MDE2496099.1 sigma-70 family RNA polymerase sigma factor [Alphaproteobacteria bacterium]